MKNIMNTRFVASLLAIAVTMLVGCGGYDADAALQKVNGTNAQKLANLYAMHQQNKRGIGPKDEARFRLFVETINPGLLKRIDVDPTQLDSLFVSERDGEEFEIRYGVKGSDMSLPEAIIFEKTGVDGVRLVAFTGQKLEEISDDAEYQRLLKGK